MIAAWKLPLIVSAIAISIVAGFYLGGPGLGMAVGFLAAASLVVMAIRNPPRPAIVPRRAADGRERLLVVLTGETEAEQVAAAASVLAEDGKADEVLILAPLHQRFLDRWACDTDRAHAEAQDRLVVTVATLAKAGVAAGARLGDEDPVQAVEDTVGTYAATRVALVAGEGRAARARAAAEELRERLAVPFLGLSAPAAALRESPAAECSEAGSRRRRRGARGRAAPASAAARRRSR
ncbi:MAG TPA: hypothetical protein VHA54_05220 [Solirubrobacterales bacterium]|nr:hypothetical protein [Solirubrobacterales bacterium]